MKTMKTGLSILALLFSVSVLVVTATFAAEELDVNFGPNNDGIVIGNLSAGDDEAYDLVVQGDDGKIVVVGSSSTGLEAGNADVAIVRYTADGMLDETFGVAGSSIVDFEGKNDVGRDAALQTDGMVLVTGYTYNDTDEDFFLLRFFEDGQPDEAFNGNAKSEIEDLFDGSNGKAFAVVVQKDGNIVVAGYTTSSEAGQRIALVRFTEKGMADTNFGENGLVVLEKVDTISFESAAYAMEIDSTGAIVLAGIVKNDERIDAAVFRFTSKGIFDTTFNDSGYVISGRDDVNSVANAVAIQSDNKIVIAGGTDGDDDPTMFVARYDSMGVADPEFGTAGDGIVNHDPGFASSAYDVVIAPDNSILTTGYGQQREFADVLLSHYSSTGELLAVTTQTAAQSAPGDAPPDNIMSRGISINPLQVEDGGAETVDDISDAVAEDELSDALLVNVGQGDAVGQALLVKADGSILTAGIAYASQNAGELYSDFALLRFAKTSEIPTVLGTDYYYIGTISVTNVSRNSAVTGGKITKKDPKDETTPNVTARGVVYGVVPHPVYRVATTATTPETAEASTDTPEDATTTPSAKDSTTTTTEGVFGETPTHNYEVVRSGQTSDGSGVGVFGSDIHSITPDNWYYVRAYAVLDDDANTVIYGNEFSFLTEDACFIATAAYGSILEKQVQVLRDFRDVYLLTNALGQKFVGLYYKWSPPMADIIAGNETLRGITRVALLPIIWISKFMLYANLYMKLLVGGVFVALMTLIFRKRMRLSEIN